MTDKKMIAVLGAGAWGTAIAMRLAMNGHRVNLWGRDDAVAMQINTLHTTPYLPDVILSDNIFATTDLKSALKSINYLIIAVPSKAFHPVCLQIADLIPFAKMSVAWATKGIDIFTGQLLSDELQKTYGIDKLVFISGPSFALEVAQQKPTAINLVSNAPHFQNEVFADLSSPFFRIYKSDDLAGSQICAIYKNVLAIAAGICDGLQMGLNARAALLTRGLEEMRRLVVSMGGKEKTVYGLCGMGDLLLTATGDLSRNRRFGLALAEYKNIDKAADKVGKTIEGQANIHWLLLNASKHDIELPICKMVEKVLLGQISIDESIQLLLERTPTNY